MYKGKTLELSPAIGGMVGSEEYEKISPTDLVEPTRNLNLDEKGYKKRGGTSKVNTTPISGSPQVKGLLQAIFADGTKSLITGCSDGKLYKDYTTVMKTGLSTSNYFNMLFADDKVFICDNTNLPRVWEGAVTTQPFSGLESVSGDLDFPAGGTTITDSSSRFLTRGFASGQVIRIENSTSNDGIETITSISAGIITCSGASFTEESCPDGTFVTFGQPTDWAAANDYPRQFVAYGNKNSRRLCGFGVPNYPYTVYVGKSGLIEDMSDANVKTFIIDTADGYGIIAGGVFGSRLLAFGKTKTYILNDSNIDSQYWGFYPAQWKGGVANHRLIIETPNDLVLMSEDGEIYSVAAVNSFGDYKKASIIRPSFMHKWIRTNVDLTKIADFHGVFNSELNAVQIFVQLKSGSAVDTCLTFFLDRGVKDGWMVHDNASSDSGYTCFTSTEVEKSTGAIKVYTGGTGHVWELNTVNYNDNNNAFYGGFKTPKLYFDEPLGDKSIRMFRGFFKASGDWDLQVRIWVDDVLIKQDTLNLKGGGSILGTGKMGSFVLGGNELIDRFVDINTVGKYLELEIFNEELDQGFFMGNKLIMFKPLGTRLR
jgi:hypothetical protein